MNEDPITNQLIETKRHLEAELEAVMQRVVLPIRRQLDSVSTALNYRRGEPVEPVAPEPHSPVLVLKPTAQNPRKPGDKSSKPGKFMNYSHALMQKTLVDYAIRVNRAFSTEEAVTELISQGVIPRRTNTAVIYTRKVLSDTLLFTRHGDHDRTRWASAV